MRYFFGFLVTILLIVTLIFLIFHGSGDKKVPSTTKALTSYSATDAEVSMTIDGPINANSQHQELRITVSRDNVTFEEFNGYDGSVTKHSSYDNTQTAYDNFLHAIEGVGFTQGNTDKAVADETGVCPLGSRFIFKLTQDNIDIERFWASTCGPKTYQGRLDATIQLFENQVPDYSTQVADFSY
jgi:hypothetical protein